MRSLGWLAFGLVACQGGAPEHAVDRPSSAAELSAVAVGPSPSPSSAPSASSVAAPSAVAEPRDAATANAPPARRAVRYLALGDSFTIGTGSSEADAFPAVFARTSGCDVSLLNVARNGYTTDDVLQRELPALAEFHPDLVTLGIGANDRVRGRPIAAYAKNVAKILDAVLAAGLRPENVVLVPQPDWSRSPAARDFGDPAELARSIVEMNRVLREEGARRGMPWLALDALMTEQAARGDLAPDHLHPSREAHAAWAAELVRAACPR